MGALNAFPNLAPLPSSAINGRSHRRVELPVAYQNSLSTHVPMQKSIPPMTKPGLVIGNTLEPWLIDRQWLEGINPASRSRSIGIKGSREAGRA